MTKQIDELSHNLEMEKRKNERLRETIKVNDSPAPKLLNMNIAANKKRHTSSSASEPEHEEVNLKINSKLISNHRFFFLKLKRLPHLLTLQSHSQAVTQFATRQQCLHS